VESHCAWQIADDEKTDKAWREIVLRLRIMMDFIADCIEQNCKLLICCDYGVSTGTTVLLAYLLLKRRYRIESSLAYLKQIRRQVQPGPGLWRGLVQVQEGLDTLKLRRLEYRVKHCELMDLDR
jgi:protein-tyrosine phosphatase